ncbi:Hypothetical predicted protein [Lecanosticta acicola]|uniref:Coagulation factor 5/8 type domain-containing protein n=1 Tax=Lecanosticta acicola TaxID=111012 RepID=A0AAI9ED39_9PEZI|nr:Hypothetical predicted protein [Lecanosticta acicola]
MLPHILRQATVWLLVATLCAAQSDIKFMYLYKNAKTSNNQAIKTKGFNALSIFGVDLKTSGDIVWKLSVLDGSPDVTLASNGSYVGGSDYANLIKAYKTGNTHIDRVEVTLGQYQNIKTQVGQGIGPSTTLYRNLAALKHAWNLDAITNDDEAEYDLSSTVKFALMLGRIGYKFTAAPYTEIDYWAELVSQVNGNTSGLFDRAYLQCYDGGAGNDPSQWIDSLKIPIIPLLWVTNDAKPADSMTPQQSQSQFQNWTDNDRISGGGYWNNYDIEKQNSSYSAYANVLNQVFG